MNKFNYLLFGSLGLFSIVATSAHGGELVLRNTSNQPIDCLVDGWTVATGADSDWQITVQPRSTFYVIPNPNLGDSARIDWVECGSLRTRMMNITPSGPRQHIVLNGTQTRVLNVSLYPWLPTIPGDRFEELTKHVINRFQRQNPDVLLNAVLSQEVDIYDYDSLATLAGPDGFDILEIDMVYLGYLVDLGLINPAQVPNNVLPVARMAVTIDGVEYAVPTLLCFDFVFALDDQIHQVQSLDDLLAFLDDQDPQKVDIAGIFNGTWRTVTMYINGYVDEYGYSNLADALTMPPDPVVIDNLVSVLNRCEDDGENKCIDDTYYNQPNGSVERDFAADEVDTSLGFSEQSFFVNLYGQDDPFYLAPMVWGSSSQPLLYADGFVTNAATCAPNTTCSADAAAFITLMTRLPMRNYIVKSRDLPRKTPWRTLLVANGNFWNQPAVINHPVYSQISSIFATAKPLPNNLTPQQQQDIYDGVCTALRDELPDFEC
jgi:thiamine pyridinylase